MPGVHALFADNRDGNGLHVCLAGPRAHIGGSIWTGRRPLKPAVRCRAMTEQRLRAWSRLQAQGAWTGRGRRASARCRVGISPRTIPHVLGPPKRPASPSTGTSSRPRAYTPYTPTAQSAGTTRDGRMSISLMRDTVQRLHAMAPAEPLQRAARQRLDIMFNDNAVSLRYSGSCAGGVLPVGGVDGARLATARRTCRFRQTPKRPNIYDLAQSPAPKPRSGRPLLANS